MNVGKKRPFNHIKGDLGVSILKSYFPASWVPREYTPDYGIDLSVELFNQCEGGYVTSGEHIFFQVKGTEELDKCTIKVKSRMNVEKDYKTTSEEVKEIEVVKFRLDTDFLFTVEKMGSAVPVILAVVDVITKDAFFVCLNDYIEKIIVPENSNYVEQSSKIIYIPLCNKINNENGIRAIEWYAKRPKLYSLFNKINYQKRELQYCDQYDIDKMLTHFLKILLRSDAWAAKNYFGAMRVVKEKIDYYIEHGITEDADKLIKARIEQGEDVDEQIWEASYCSGLVSFREAQRVQSLQRLWDSLCLMGDVFEDITKEMFLPTSLGIDIN
ncbi:MAG: hypothetical protein PWP07_557 [Epulopiscium sp.]|nr:hypothetical protein [Candidatus Epulonipiscium sp.]